jgi:3-hydroxyisobutyrate dehydrogenase-like beta-hydroxyacid dehydrogenase
MAGHLLGAGHKLFALSRSGVPAELVASGATACTTGRDVAGRADVIFVMVPDTPDVELGTSASRLAPLAIWDCRSRTLPARRSSSTVA